MWFPRALTVVGLLAAFAACADQPTEPATQPEQPRPAPLPLGVYEISLAGLDGNDDAAGLSKAVAITPQPSGPSMAMSVASPGLTLELVSSSTFTEGTRGLGGQRFASFTFRVRNSTGAPVNNVTFIPVTSAGTTPGTPFSQMLLFNNTPAAASVATSMVPTGAVFVGEDTRLRTRFPDVLQAFEEAEVSAIALPAGVTGIFPYGFVASNPATNANRTIPVAANANDWGGTVTFAFRYPLQATVHQDPFFMSVQVLAVQDTETRMTESFEERQDTAGVRRLRERATSLGATTVTVLAGSPAMDPFVTDYPGQRQVCSVRTAGPAGSPTTRINAPGAYTELPVYRPGEATSVCGAYFTSGTAAPAYYGLPYHVTVRAMDRYGNVKTTQVDTVTLSSTDGTASMPAAGALFSGIRSFDATYTTYGLSTLRSTGRRIRGSSPVLVNGNTRRWTGDVNNSWFTAGDWRTVLDSLTGVPGAQDSIIILGDRPNYPLFVQNMAAPNVTMVAGTTVQPTINLSSFDFTINGSLEMGSTGTFTGTGRVILAGTSATFGGGLSNVNFRNLRILGSYTTTSNVNVTGGRIVVQGGRLRTVGNRIRVRPS